MTCFQLCVYPVHTPATSVGTTLSNQAPNISGATKCTAVPLMVWQHWSQQDVYERTGTGRK